MKNAFKSALLVLAITLSLAACNSGNRAPETGTGGDTALTDTPVTTDTRTDTLNRDSLKEGVDGTGKSISDPRTRKQQ
jgi:hypothetical protein